MGKTQKNTRLKTRRCKPKRASNASVRKSMGGTKMKITGFEYTVKREGETLRNCQLMKEAGNVYLQEQDGGQLWRVTRVKSGGSDWQMVIPTADEQKFYAEIKQCDATLLETSTAIVEASPQLLESLKRMQYIFTVGKGSESVNIFEIQHVASNHLNTEECKKLFEREKITNDWTRKQALFKYHPDKNNSIAHPICTQINSCAELLGEEKAKREEIDSLMNSIRELISHDSSEKLKKKLRVILNNTLLVTGTSAMVDPKKQSGDNLSLIVRPDDVAFRTRIVISCVEQALNQNKQSGQVVRQISASAETTDGQSEIKHGLFGGNKLVISPNSVDGSEVTSESQREGIGLNHELKQGESYIKLPYTPQPCLNFATGQSDSQDAQETPIILDNGRTVSQNGEEFKRETSGNNGHLTVFSKGDVNFEDVFVTAFEMPQDDTESSWKKFEKLTVRFLSGPKRTLTTTVKEVDHTNHESGVTLEDGTTISLNDLHKLLYPHPFIGEQLEFDGNVETITQVTSTRHELKFITMGEISKDVTTPAPNKKTAIKSEETANDDRTALKNLWGTSIVHSFVPTGLPTRRRSWKEVIEHHTSGSTLFLQQKPKNKPIDPKAECVINNALAALKKLRDEKAAAEKKSAQEEAGSALPESPVRQTTLTPDDPARPGHNQNYGIIISTKKEGSSTKKKEGVGFLKEEFLWRNTDGANVEIQSYENMLTFEMIDSQATSEVITRLFKDKGTFTINEDTTRKHLNRYIVSRNTSPSNKPFPLLNKDLESAGVYKLFCQSDRFFKSTHHGYGKEAYFKLNVLERNALNTDDHTNTTEENIKEKLKLQKKKGTNQRNAVLNVSKELALKRTEVHKYATRVWETLPSI
jgi:hypothetical protein